MLAIGLAACLSVIGVPTAAAQDADITSVVILRSQEDRSGPNEGTWFVHEIEPGGSGRDKAIVHNPADVPQVVDLAIEDLVFNSAGSPAVPDREAIDVGTWTTLDRTKATIGPGESIEVGFTIDVPDNAEPGDHIGVFTATTTNQQGDFAVARRIARRLYVTVPGDVTPAWEVEAVDLVEQSSFIPTTAALTVQLRNTGRVRVEPTVTAGDVQLTGSPILVAQSVERYMAEIDLPWWGGPVSVPIEITTADGQVRSTSASIFVIPVGPLLILLTSLLSLYGIRRWLRSRVSRTEKLRQDVERLERMLREQAAGGAVGGAVPAPELDIDLDELEAEPATNDQRAQLQMAAKRAKRSGDHRALASIAQRLHEHDGDALEVLLEAASVSRDDGADLLDAAASYGTSALSHRLAERLRPEQRTLLERRVAEQLLGMHASTASASVGEATPAVADDRFDLARVPGLGEAKQAALLEHFGSLDAVVRADVEDLLAVRGIGPGLAARVVEHTHADTRA